MNLLAIDPGPEQSGYDWQHPEAPLIERLDRGENNIRRLAESFLGRGAA